MSPGPEDLLSQREKRSVLENDRSVRVQQRGSTFADFAQSEAAEPRGRYTANEKSTVVGASPIPPYPQGPNWCAGDQGLESGVGYAIGDPPPPVGEPHEIAASLEKLGVTGSPSGSPDSGAAVAPASVTFPEAVETAAPAPSDDDPPPEAA